MDVTRVVEWAVAVVGNEIQRRARLVQELGPVLMAHGNEARLGQVLVNLLINAAQAIGEGNAERNQVRIVARTDERGWVVVEVHDTGCGIAPELQGRILEPFFTTKEVGVGTGLGLSICHGIITDLGGEIFVASVPGEGSRFSVALPPAERRVPEAVPRHRPLA